VNKATSQGYSVEFGDDVCQLKNSQKIHGCAWNLKKSAL
jgi:hypothetical protein